MHRKVNTKSRAQFYSKISFNRPFGNWAQERPSAAMSEEKRLPLAGYQEPKFHSKLNAMQQLFAVRIRLLFN